MVEGLFNCQSGLIFRINLKHIFDSKKRKLMKVHQSHNNTKWDV